MSYWWARLRHRLFCRQTVWCQGHRYWDYPKYPAYERQFGRARTYRPVPVQSPEVPT